MTSTAEYQRLDEARRQSIPWKQWGPYLSERQWGTVREDYSDNGNAWDYFSHDQARSRVYHWGEDGLARWWDSCPYAPRQSSSNGNGSASEVSGRHGRPAWPGCPSC